MQSLVYKESQLKIDSLSNRQPVIMTLMTAASIHQFNYNCPYNERLDCGVSCRRMEQTTKGFFNHSNEVVGLGLVPNTIEAVEAEVKAATLHTLIRCILL